MVKKNKKRVKRDDEIINSFIQNKARGTEVEIRNSERDDIDDEGSKSEQDGNGKRSFADKDRSHNVLILTDTNKNKELNILIN